jgi:hypothetical protein
MADSTRSQVIIALFAAYVVALQALFLPLSVAAWPFAGSGLCQSAVSIGGSGPAGHENGCPCAAGCGVQCCAQNTLLPPQIAVSFVVTQVVASTPAHFVEPVPQPSNFGPHAPRAPPVT